MKLAKLIKMAAGEAPADLLLKNARIVNVFSGDIQTADIAIADSLIAGIGTYAAETPIDLEGQYVAPGFIDAHMHLESAMTSITEFARTVLPRGTTAIIADPHEIANVLGPEGIRYMIQSSLQQPMTVRFTLPSCVPATHMETAGAAFGVEEMNAFWGEEQIVALAEMMNFPGVVAGIPEVLEKIEAARRRGYTVDGHAPGLSGKALNAYSAAGITSDHECTTAAEAREKLALGMHIMIREGTCAQNLEDLLAVVNDQTWPRMMWCTDDRHPQDLLADGHMDAVINKAIKLGLDPIRAIQMGTINPANYFGLKQHGAIAPGRRADLVVFSDLSDLKIDTVYVGGRLVAERGAMHADIQRPRPVSVPPAFQVEKSAIHFDIRAQSQQIRVIQVVADQLITRQKIVNAPIQDGLAVSDPSRDLLKIAVIERHQSTGNIGKGFVSGMGLQKGALASSVAHDSHNIIVVGTNDADMDRAVSEIIEMKGGLAAVAGDEWKVTLPLPIAGLMSERPVEEVSRQLDALIEISQQWGARLKDPFMALSFLALPVIPDLKITDLGLVDVNRFELVPLFVS
jgi:adenine deaminase